VRNSFLFGDSDGDSLLGCESIKTCLGNYFGFGSPFVITGKTTFGWN